MSEDRKLLWLDLETTGSGDKAEIIEVGCLLTDSNLIEIPEFGERSWVVRCSTDGIWDILHTPAVRDMHTKNSLLWEVIDNKDNVYNLDTVENDLVSRLYRIEPKQRQIMIAGSGVGHFDRRIIHRQMLKLDQYLHYAPFDIGNIRRAFRAWGIPTPGSGNKERKNHRALDDAKLHLEEARAYKQLFEKLLGGPVKFAETIPDDMPSPDDWNQLSPTQRANIRSMIAGYIFP